MAQKTDVIAEIKHMRFGIGRLFHKSRLLRFIRLLVLVSFLSICIYSMVISVNDYYSYQVTATYRLLTEQDSIFPSVLLCNLRPFNSKYGVAFINKLSIGYGNKFKEAIQTDLFWEAYACINACINACMNEWGRFERPVDKDIASLILVPTC